MIIPMMSMLTLNVSDDLSSKIRYVNYHVSIKKSLQYSEYIDSISTSMGVDKYLVASVMAVESHFNPKAVGTKGEQGLMQLDPKFHGAHSLEYDNIKTGVRYIKLIKDKHYDEYDGVYWIQYYNTGIDSTPKDFKYAEKVSKFYKFFSRDRKATKAGN